MGSFATFNPISTPTLPLKGREFATIALKLVPLDANPISYNCRVSISEAHCTGCCFHSAQ